MGHFSHKDGENSAKNLWPVLILKVGKLENFWPFCPLFVVYICRKDSKSASVAKKSGQMASFENKSGHGKTCQPCGFAGFVARNPLFFSIKCEKKNTIFIKVEKNFWPSGHKTLFGSF